MVVTLSINQCLLKIFQYLTIDCKTIEYLEACVNSKDESSIDKLVYNLYKLTDDEIRYIEKGRS